jgi:bacitracin transport system ATP-binding protein
MSSYVIETNGLTKIFDEQNAVNDVSLRIKSGEIYGLLGRNGAGKTTIMKMLLGLTSITSGNAFLFGMPLEKNQKELYPRIGSIIETPGFYPNLTGYENLKYFAKLKGMKSKNAVENALEFVNLPYKDKKLFSEYSLGMKQRLGIANAIMNDPELLILDEPTNGLDPIGIAEIRGFVKELSMQKGKTVLISSHQLSEIEQIADTIGIIHHGILLEECSMNDIANTNRKHICISVTDVKKASLILEQDFALTDYLTFEPDIIRIFDLSVDTKRINRAFIDAGIDVAAIYINADNLEDYFKSITGGRGIA